MATITGGKPNQNGAILKVGQIIGRQGSVFVGSGLTGGGGGFSTAAGVGSGGSGSGGTVEISWHANYAAFPPTGTVDIVYVSKDTGLIYQWDGGGYSGLAEAGGYTNPQIDALLDGKADLIAGKVPLSQLSGYTNSQLDAFFADKADLVGGKVPLSQLSGYTDTQLDTFFAAKADLIGGLVPSNQLPSYVDDVLEFANLAAFPATGVTGKIYVAIDSGLIYRWSGSIYVEISSSSIPNASAIPSSPTGDVAATNVQDAIAELASEKTTPAAVATQLLTPKIDIAVEKATAASVSGTYNYAINSGSVARLTLTANATLGLTAPTGLIAGTAVCVTVFVNPATFTASWAADIDWGDAGSPTLTASKWNRLVFSKVHGDAKWQASAAGLGFAL